MRVGDVGRYVSMLMKKRHLPPQDSPHADTTPKISANIGTSATIATNVRSSGTKRSCGMFEMSS